MAEAGQHFHRVAALGRHLPDERQRAQWRAAFEEAEQAAWAEVLTIEDPREQERAMRAVVETTLEAMVGQSRAPIPSPSSVTPAQREADANYYASLFVNNPRKRAALQSRGLPAFMARRLRELGDDL